jgi:hypothetical protein
MTLAALVVLALSGYGLRILGDALEWDVIPSKRHWAPTRDDVRGPR